MCSPAVQELQLEKHNPYTAFTSLYTPTNRQMTNGLLSIYKL